MIREVWTLFSIIKLLFYIYIYLKCIPRGAMKTSEQGSELFSAVL